MIHSYSVYLLTLCVLNVTFHQKEIQKTPNGLEFSNKQSNIDD